jgi:hypothetical protein
MWDRNGSTSSKIQCQLDDYDGGDDDDDDCLSTSRIQYDAKTCQCSNLYHKSTNAQYNMFNHTLFTLHQRVSVASCDHLQGVFYPEYNNIQIIYKKVLLNRFTLGLNWYSATCGLSTSNCSIVRTDNAPCILPLPTYSYAIQLCICRRNLFTKYTYFTYITAIGYYLQLCCSPLQAAYQLPTLSKNIKTSQIKVKLNSIPTGLDITGWGSQVSRKLAQLRW